MGRNRTAGAFQSRRRKFLALRNSSRIAEFNNQESRFWRDESDRASPTRSGFAKTLLSNFRSISPPYRLPEPQREPIATEHAERHGPTLIQECGENQEHEQEGHARTPSL